MNAIIPRASVSIRPATLADIAFMDGLQKKYGRALGYFPTRQFEEYVQTGGVLVAETRNAERGMQNEEKASDNSSSFSVPHSSFSVSSPLGYIISRDRYLKRDELGVVYQLCVTPGTQRKLVGAALVREVFERSAYGCRLYCCWCAQDLDANYFWESLGFVPIAFRAGSDKKRRVHIFWQKRIGKGDAATPYWYPFQTSSGAIRADRLVFPIPPGVHWKDVEAVAMPGAELRKLAAAPIRAEKPRAKRIAGPPLFAPPGTVGILVGGRMKYVSRPGYVAPQGEPALAMLPALPAHPAHPALPAPKRRKPKTPPAKIDSKYLAAARELRDRYLEHLNSEQFNSPNVLPHGKYEVSRLPAASGKRATPMLAA